MEQSILKSVKKNLNVDTGVDDAFDEQIVTFINSALSTLTQLGIGPSDGFMIEDDTALWVDFVGVMTPQHNLIKTYVCLKTRLAFDPPTTSDVIDSLKNQIAELESRIRDNRESLEWVDPDPEVVIIDG